MHQFNEHHPELEGFSAYFDAQIRPLLEARDEERAEKLKMAKTYCVIIGLIGLAIFIFAAMQRVEFQLLFVIATATATLAILAYATLLKSVALFTKAQIVGGICKYVGWSFTAKPETPPPLDIWNRLYLIPNGYEGVSSLASKKVRFEDHISGQAHGAEFDSIEVKLEKRQNNSTTVEFHGQLITLTFPRKFLGRTIVLRDKGRFQRKKKSDMKRVGLVDPVFEEIFEAYGTDQVEARYLLDPVFMQKLVDLETSIEGQNIRFGFFNSQLYIAIETGDRYEAGSMSKSLMDPSRTQNLLDEIGAIYDVVDGVMERPPRSV